MADPLPRPETVGGAVWRHDWYPYEGYRTVHERYISNAINEGIVTENRLAIVEYRDGQRLAEVRVTGRIACAYGLSISVDKWLEVDARRRVRGYLYSYHAWLTETGQEVIRYDNSHDPDDLHCHLFDLYTGRESIYPVPRCRLPTLDGFIRIAVRLAQQHQDEVL